MPTGKHHDKENKAQLAKDTAAGGKRPSWDVKVRAENGPLHRSRRSAAHSAPHPPPQGMMADEKRKTQLLKAKLQEKQDFLEQTNRNLREKEESGGRGTAAHSHLAAVGADRAPVLTVADYEKMLEGLYTRLEAKVRAGMFCMQWHDKLACCIDIVDAPFGRTRSAGSYGSRTPRTESRSAG